MDGLASSPKSRLQRVSSSVLISAMLSERDADPVERMELRRKLETERRQQRKAEERARAHQQKKDNRIRDGEEAFRSLWIGTENRFQSDEASKQLILRSIDKLSGTISRRDNPRVLIVSDHPWRQGFYVELLRMVGCQCDTTRYFSHGVSMAAPLVQRSAETSYDLLILDRPRKAASDAEAAQMLMDFAYRVRVRDSVYRKEYLTTVTNRFLFVLGETDMIPQFLVQGTGGAPSAPAAPAPNADQCDAACIRRPLYFHLKKIRQLLLPPFINTQLRLRLYRRDPNFTKIDRMFRQVTPRKDKRGAKEDPASSTRSESPRGKAKHADVDDEDDAKKKNFVTFEGLQQENEDLHNVIISHIRNKARMEEQIKELETNMRDMQDRYRYTIQGLEGQLRDKDTFIGELGDVANELRQTLHEAQVREMQLTTQLAQAQKRSKKKEAQLLQLQEKDAAREGEGDDSSNPTSNVRRLVVTSDTQRNDLLAGSPTDNASLSNRLEVLMRQQVEEARRRKVMLDSVGDAFHDAAVNKEAKLHAVEINSKPIQCDIWYQSPQEQNEILKFMAQQYGGGGVGPTAKGSRKSVSRTTASSKTVSKSNAPAEESTSPDASRSQSRSQSRQVSRQNSRGGATSRASSITSADDEFPGSPIGVLQSEFHSPFDVVFRGGAHDAAGDDTATASLRVENNALRKQLQFFKAQRRMSSDVPSISGPPGCPGTTVAAHRRQDVVPTAEVLVPDGQSDVAFLHKKIASLSQQVSVLESSLVHARAVAPAALASPGTDHLSSTGTPPPEETFPCHYALPPHLVAGSTPQSEGLEAIPVPPIVPSSASEALVRGLRETISRLEYKVHTLDLLRITNTMQKLVYKGAMLRALKGDGDQDVVGASRRKAFTKELGVNTTLEGVGAAAAMWDGDTLFSPKEMEDRINNLGLKLKESNMMFKESQEQHIQSERRLLEMKLELEKMHNNALELTESLKVSNRRLSTIELALEESQVKCTALDAQCADQLVSLGEQERLIAVLRHKPLVIPVGCQTKLSGDVAKKSANPGGTVGASITPSRMLDVMKEHGHDGGLTPRSGGEAAGGHRGITPSATSAATLLDIPPGIHSHRMVTPRATPRNCVVVASGLSDAQEGDGAQALHSPSSSAIDLAASVVDGAPSHEEIDFLVTTRMAALALYSTAHVDGADVPRKEHDEIVQKLQKDVTDSMITISKLNDVRNAQRTEITEYRSMLREMKDQKNSMPEVKAQLESLTLERDEERRNAATRERLLRKEFDALRLKYAHDDDNVAMAAFDIDAFAVHTLKAPLDIPNDRSTRFVCKSVEHVLGVARRLLSTAHSRGAVVFQNAQSQTPASFLTHGAEPQDNSDGRPRRRSVLILDSSGPTSNNAPGSHAGEDQSNKRRVGISFHRSKLSPNPSTDFAASVPVETVDADMQTVWVPPYSSDAAIQCSLAQELSAALPPRRIHHGRGKVATTRREEPSGNASLRNASPDALGNVAQSPTGGAAREIPTSSLPTDDPAQTTIQFRGTTPMQRSSLLHTPASRSQSRLLRQHATPELDDSGFGSEPSSMFGSAAHYELVPLLETKCTEVQTDPHVFEMPHMTNVVEWIRQTDAIQSLLGLSMPQEQRSPLSSAASTNQPATTTSAMTEPRPELISAVRIALSSLISGKQAECIQESNTEASAIGLAAPLEVPSLLTIIPQNASLSSQSPRHAGSRTPRLPVVGRCVQAVTQTDPVDIKPVFSVFGGNFDQARTTKLPPAGQAGVLRAIQLKPPQEDVGVQVELLIDRSDDDRSSDEDDPPPQGTCGRQATPVVGVGATESPVAVSLLVPSAVPSISPRSTASATSREDDNATGGQLSTLTHRRARRPRRMDSTKRAPAQPSMDTACQTEADANPSKLLASVIALHNSFQKLVSKLRAPLRLGNAIPSIGPSDVAHPTIKGAVEWCMKNCSTIDLIIEKLAVAQRGLRNLGLRGVDLSIASLNVLVAEGEDAEVVGDDGGPSQRHVAGGDFGGTSGPLPPLLKAAVGRHHPPLQLGSSTRYHVEPSGELAAAVNITMMSTDGAMSGTLSPSLLVPLPPIRGVDEVLLSSPPAPLFASPAEKQRRSPVQPSAVDPARASGSPALPECSSLVGISVGASPTTREAARKVNKHVAAASPEAACVDDVHLQLKRPLVHTHRALHAQAGGKGGATLGSQVLLVSSEDASPRMTIRKHHQAPTTSKR